MVCGKNSYGNIIFAFNMTVKTPYSLELQLTCLCIKY